MSEPVQPGTWSPRTIVVSYDGTASAEQSLRRAIDLARAFGSRVVVADVAAIAAVPLDPTPGAFGYGPYASPELFEEEARTDELVWQQHRARIEALFAQSAVEHEFDRIAGDEVGDIVDVAERHHADVVVLGAHEPGFLERLVGGSVGDAVARRAHCDVLIVRSEHK